MSIFQFKKFSVKQDNSSMKVGTDAVLLGCWTQLRQIDKQLLEVGTGCGVISLIIAQRYNFVNIDAIDIDKASILDAKDNFNYSPWNNRLSAINDSLQTYNSDKQYDIIVSNPPYFNNSLQCPNNQRSVARHTNTLSYNDLLSYSHKLLSTNGIFSVILPFEEGKEFINLAKQYHFSVNRITKVYPTPTSIPKRLLIELQKNENILGTEKYINQSEKAYIEDILTIEISRHNYTEEYIGLTKEFYLKM